ncbi:hypothetical protein KM043_003320 [Ampulex compressa]|nr:hypothetical protein KM043_003320 [Ampulex compressa]
MYRASSRSEARSSCTKNSSPPILPAARAGAASRVQIACRNGQPDAGIYFQGRRRPAGSSRRRTMSFPEERACRDRGFNSSHPLGEGFGPKRARPREESRAGAETRVARPTDGGDTAANFSPRRENKRELAGGLVRPGGTPGDLVAALEDGYGIRACGLLYFYYLFIRASTSAPPPSVPPPRSSTVDRGPEEARRVRSSWTRKIAPTIARGIIQYGFITIVIMQRV